MEETYSSYATSYLKTGYEYASDRYYTIKDWAWARWMKWWYSGENETPMLVYTRCWRCHGSRPESSVHHVSSLRGKYCEDCYSNIYSEVVNSMIKNMFGNSSK